MNNQKKSRNWVNLILLIALIGMLSAGCGNTNDKQSNAEQTPTVQPKSEVPKEEVPTVVADTKPTEIKVMNIFYNAAPKDDSEIELEIEKHTNTNLDITWVPNAAYTDKMNATLASGELPQVFYVSANRSANIINAVNAGAFWEIGPYLHEFPNLSKINQDVLMGGAYDGKVYLLNRATNPARHIIAYRKDWLNNLGLQVPETLDDLYKVAKAFSDDDPDMNQKDDTYGFVEVDYLDTLTRSISMYFGAPRVWGITGDKLLPAFESPEYLEALKYYRRMYDEKILNQNFILTNGAQRKDDGIKGKVGILICADSDVRAIVNGSVKLNPKAEWGFIQGVTGPKGLRVSATGGFLGGFMFPKSSVKTEDDLRKILAFFDKLSTPEEMTLLVYGIEGVDYTVEDNIAVPIPERAESRKANNNYRQLHILSTNIALKAKSDPLTAEVAELVEANEKIAVYDVTRALYSKTNAEKGPELEKIIKDATVKFIMEQIDEAAYKQAIEAWHKAGGDQIISEMTEEYQKSIK